MTCNCYNENGKYVLNVLTGYLIESRIAEWLGSSSTIPRVVGSSQPTYEVMMPIHSHAL